MGIFLLGGQRRKGFARRTYLIGVIWTQLLWILPLADYGFGSPYLRVSVEDGMPLGPLHTAASCAVFFWPLLAFGYLLFQSRWHLNDIPARAKEVFPFLVLFTLAGLSLVGVMAGLILENLFLYRLFNITSQAVVLGWYLMTVRYPPAFGRVRFQIKQKHEFRKQRLDSGEAQIIAQRLIRAVDDQVFCGPELHLTDLANRIKIPPYRLSWYLRESLKTTFPAWINARRIEWICRRLDQNPEQNIQDLALAAGYNSRSAFYTQFIKLTGVKPSDYASGRRLPSVQ